MNPIASLSRREAEELLLLQRRVAYLSAKNDPSDSAYTTILNLRDVGSFHDFIEQLSKIKS
jgi:hypothetical protein